MNQMNVDERTALGWVDRELAGIREDVSRRHYMNALVRATQISAALLCLLNIELKGRRDEPGT